MLGLYCILRKLQSYGNEEISEKARIEASIDDEFIHLYAIYEPWLAQQRLKIFFPNIVIFLRLF